MSAKTFLERQYLDGSGGRAYEESCQDGSESDIL